MADTYLKKMRRHLADYKREVLGVGEPGVFRYRGRDVMHDHVLPQDSKWLNLLEPFRDRIQNYLKENDAVTLHRYFHHLTSSQAFALNLFYPFMEGGPVAVGALQRALGFNGNVRCWYPEHVEDLDEGTNVDIAWESVDGSWTFCEVKLTEGGFGTSAADERHLRKLSETYRPVLEPYCSEQLLSKGRFFKSYQLLRNIWLAARDPRSRVLFLIPLANVALWRELDSTLPEIDRALRDRIHVSSIESVLSSLVSDATLDPALRGYALLMQNKYILPG